VPALGGEFAFLRVVMRSTCKASSSTRDLGALKEVYLVNLGVLDKEDIEVDVISVWFLVRHIFDSDYWF